MPSPAAEPKPLATSFVQPVDPISPNTPFTSDAISPVKNQPFANVTRMSSDPASSTPPAPAARSNFLGRFWGRRSPSSKNIRSTVDEKNGKSLRTFAEAMMVIRIRDEYDGHA